MFTADVRVQVPPRPPKRHPFWGVSFCIQGKGRGKALQLKIAGYIIIQGDDALIDPQIAKLRLYSKPHGAFGSGSSGGNVLVSARTLRRSRLKGRCRKAAPLRNPRPHRRKRIKIFQVAVECIRIEHRVPLIICSPDIHRMSGLFAFH